MKEKKQIDFILTQEGIGLGLRPIGQDEVEQRRVKWNAAERTQGEE
jgi:hypothetical protein